MIEQYWQTLSTIPNLTKAPESIKKGPKIHTLGKNLFIGFKLIISQNSGLVHMKVPEDLLEVLKKVNQNISMKVELGAGLD